LGHAEKAPTPKQENVMPPILDMEALKDQVEPLSEEQNEAIRESALKSAKAREKADVDDDDEDPFKSPLKKAEDEHVEESEEQKATREAAEAKEKEDQEREETEKAEKEKTKQLEAARAKEEKDLTDDEKTLLKTDDEVKAKAREDERAQDVEAYAEKFGLSEAQATKEVEKIHGVLDKYSRNPKDMAQALYHSNAKLTQAASELAAIKNAPKEGELRIKGKTLSKEETREYLVSKYREYDPELTEGLEDDKVFKLAWEKLVEKQKIAMGEAQKDLKDKAESKRREILEAIPEVDKKFLKDIRGSLYRVSDNDILQDDFEVEDYVRWARGGTYHKDIKAAVDKAVAEALKNKKIVGIQPGSGGAGAGTPPKKGGSTSLTDEDKETALDMYGSLKVEDSKKFALYEDFKKSQSKKKE